MPVATEAPGTRRHRPAPRMDPRIRRRRIEVQRQQGRRRLAVLVGLVGMAGSALAVWGVLHSPLADLDAFEVVGSTNTDAVAVAAATGLERGSPMLTLDLAAAAEGVEALAWVRSATVNRRWPDTVEVRVVERVAAATATAGDSGWMVLDPGGRVLEVASEPPGELTVVEIASGPLVPGAVVEGAGELLEVARRIPSRLRPEVAAVGLGDDGIVLRLEAGGKAVVGSVSQLEAKLQALATLLEKVAGADEAVLDVRLPYSPVIQRPVAVAEGSNAG